MDYHITAAGDFMQAKLTHIEVQGRVYGGPAADLGLCESALLFKCMLLFVQVALSFTDCHGARSCN